MSFETDLPSRLFLDDRAPLTDLEDSPTFVVLESRPNSLDLAEHLSLLAPSQRITTLALDG